MRRRDLLRTSAAAVGGGAAGLALTQLAGDASATTALTLDVSGDSATVDDAGDITAVSLEVDVEWSYELPETATPEAIEIDVRVDGTTVAEHEEAQLFSEAEGTESIAVDLLDDALAAGELTPADGTRETTVAVRVELAVVGGGDELAGASAESEATIAVTRAGEAAASVGGEGVITIETG